MKLRNKKTGEIKDVESLGHEKWLRDKYGPQITLSWNTEYENLGECRTYNSLAELNREWEDYEEKPKGYWFIDAYGNIVQNEITKHYGDEYTDMTAAYESQKQIGNHFETPEEAEKAVEKLKAWKRLKDGGITFKNWTINQTGTIDCFATWGDNIPPSRKNPTLLEDLDLLFGGEG